MAAVTPTALVIIGIGWGVLLPVLALIAEALIDSPMLEAGQTREGSASSAAKTQAAVALMQSGREINS